MSRPPGLRTPGRLIAAGLVVEFGTLFWNHPVSFFLFLGVGAVLIATGMAIYLRSLVA